jgi:hypothetical protein
MMGNEQSKRAPNVSDRFHTQHIPTAALASALDGRLVSTDEHPITRRIEWTFDGVPSDLLERVIADEIRVSAKRMLSALEEMHRLLLQYRRRR